MQFVRRLLGEQRKRAVAGVMTAIEQRVNGRLEEDEQVELRRQVLASINAYHDTVLDILKSSVNDGTAVNEDALRLIAEFNRHVHRMRGG